MTDPEMTARRRPGRRLYALALLGAGTLVFVAWIGRGSFGAVGAGTPAPDFTASTLTGEVSGLDDYRGNVILVNVWATWCPPCREEMPSMERLYRSFKERDADFEILAVSIDASEGERDVGGNTGGDLAAFVEEFGITFTILHDPSGSIQQIYQTTGVPESFIIGKDGIIYRRLSGPTDWDAEGWHELIERLLGSSDPPV